MNKLRLNNTRAKTAEKLLIVSGVFTLISIFSNSLEYILLNNVLKGGTVTMEQANMNDMRQLIIGVLQTVVYIFSIITFIQWFRRAYYNQEVKFSQMESTNGWTSGAWFIPIYSLYRPFQLMKEIYRNAENFIVKHALGEEKPNRFTTISWWWALWIIANITSNVVTRMSIRNDDLSTLANLSMASVIVDIIYIPLTILAIKTIRNYNEMELLILSSEEDGIRVHSSNDTDLLDANI